MEANQEKVSSMTKLIVFLGQEMLLPLSMLLKHGRTLILQSRIRLPQAPMTLLHLVVVLGLQAHSQAPEGQVVVNHPMP